MFTYYALSHPGVFEETELYAPPMMTDDVGLTAIDTTVNQSLSRSDLNSVCE